jgi:hypothetical protein
MIPRDIPYPANDRKLYLDGLLWSRWKREHGPKLPSTNDGSAAWGGSRKEQQELRAFYQGAVSNE